MQCQEFKEKMEEMIALQEDTSSPNTSNVNVSNITTPDRQNYSTSSESNSPVVNKVTSNIPLSQMFKKVEGSWDCGACYVTNKPDVIQCVACNTAKPGCEAQVEKEKQSIIDSAPKFNFSFGSNPLTPPQFKVGSTSSVSSLPVNFGSQLPVTANTTATTTPTFNFSFKPLGVAEPKKSDSLNEDEKKPSGSTPGPFASLTFSSTSSFGDVSKSSNRSSPFGSAGEFKPFGGNPPVSKTEDKTPTPAKNSEEETPDEFVPTAEFTPVIPLPPLVEVKKGDENENVIFQHRAKIFRFVPDLKEWKERGLGDIKILQDKNDASKIRIVMWREKILKLACNHWLKKGMKIDYCQQSKKMVTWTALDFAEEEQKTEIFTCKFGNEDAVSFIFLNNMFVILVYP